MSKKLIKKYSHKGIIVDTNILLLYIIGKYDKNFIESFKRTQKYVKDDFELLKAFISKFKVIIITPNVLTEVHNLANQSGEKRMVEINAVFKDCVNSILNEKYVDSKKIINDTLFGKLELTDVSIEIIAREGYLVLTDDFKMSQVLNSKKIDALNFNHLRYESWK